MLLPSGITVKIFYFFWSFGGTVNCGADQTFRASKVGDKELVDNLLANNIANAGAFENFASVTANIMEQLLKNEKVDPAANNLPIISAVLNGDLNAVKLLLKQPNVDPSAQSNLAFQKAVQFGRTEIVELLLADERVNPTDNKNAAILSLELYKTNNLKGEASSKDFYDILKLLLEDRRADPSANNNQLLRSIDGLKSFPAKKLLEKDHRVKGIEFLNAQTQPLTPNSFTYLLNSPLKWGTPSYVESVFSKRPNDLVALFCSDLFKIPLTEAKMIHNLDEFDKYIVKMHDELFNDTKKFMFNIKFLWRYYGETLGYKDHNQKFQHLTVFMLINKIPIV